MIRPYQFILLLFLGMPTATAHAEGPAMHAGMLAHAVDRLAVTGRVLYVAAHPDDENSRLIAYLANARHLNVAYLSMNRGGGGQNLIGSEQGDLLGVMRTQELLAARRLDGGQQRFTCTRDFGFSKSAQETLAIWGHDAALADVVWVIRTFQPDVIITRFSEQAPNHGHHTASAILAHEAFSAAACPHRFAEQLHDGVTPWQADRLLFNVTTWDNPNLVPNALSIDINGYDARLGMSYGELAALSRSQHKSQGFGVVGDRGAIIEHFVSVAGTAPQDDLFSGLDLSWQRFGRAAKPLQDALTQAQHDLSRDAPEQAIPALLQAHRALDALPDVPRVRDARTGLEKAIADAAGLFVRITAAQPAGVSGTAVTLHTEVLARRPTALTLQRIVMPSGESVVVNAPLRANAVHILNYEDILAPEAAVSTPYWLAQTPSEGRDLLRDPKLVGEAVGPAPLTARVVLQAGERTLHLDTPVLYTWNDPVRGERSRDFLRVPPATVTPTRDAVMLVNNAAAAVELRIRSGQDDLHGQVSLHLPAGWRQEPAALPIDMARAGQEITARVRVYAPADAAPINVVPTFERDGKAWAWREDRIDYAHIPLQIVLQPSRLRLVPVNLPQHQGLVGYIDGSGDSVADDLAHVGFTIERLTDDVLRSGNLQRFAAIVVGIRAYNTRPALPTVQSRLMQYVEQGGILLTQYQTNNRLAPLTLPLGPYPFSIGRERVTEEGAPVSFINAKHAVLNTPARLGAADFADWVQERGLYFADTWADAYEPIFAAADTGEAPLRGSVLFARYGKGRFIYTGLAFFRQLPAGVPGAYRLFINLLSGDTP